jgi:fructosamine-3-kinase
MIGLLPESIENSLVEYYNTKGEDLQITAFSFTSGGCINSAAMIDSNLGKQFIKWNDREKFPGMFEKEARGLKLLRAPGVIRVPEVLTTDDTGQFSYLLTEFISSGSRALDYWDQLGKNLAALHKVSNERFGLDHNNYIGSLPQSNEYEVDWITFYIKHRLEYQLKLAVDHGKMGKNQMDKFQKLYVVLTDILPGDEAPSLIHGDLWGGNLMTGPSGGPVIFDPAVYFGHREIDIAMTKLFGGFGSIFYEVYEEVFPLTAGFEDRIDIYQLYPLLVHVNLFGGGYISQVNSILNRYV